MVYGGSTYLTELGRCKKYAPLIAQLRLARKVVRLDNADVDQEEERVRGVEPHPDFDDAHLVSMVVVSGVRLVCTKDRRAHRFLKDRKFYPKGVARPLLYTSRKNAGLLTDKNIAKICR